MSEKDYISYEGDLSKTLYIAYTVPDKVDRELLKQAVAEAVYRVIQDFKDKVIHE